MAPTVPANHDPALSHNHAAPPPPPVSQLPPGIPQATFPQDLNLSIGNIDSQQIMNLLRHLPAFSKAAEAGSLKEDAAQTLSNLAQTPYQATGQHPYPGPVPGINDPGPSSHPRGPPNLGQLSALALSAAPVPPAPGVPSRPGPPQEMEEASEDRQGQAVVVMPPKDPTASAPVISPAPTTTRRGGRNAAMGSDEWSRQRKDNHKEVERRRRGNINEGINELGRIVPNGSGEKAKGAILARAVQYIHHLKENEARNIEKWTLEKLLMDQAMGDLQTQLEELKKAWENESLQRMRLEQELEQLRAQHAALLAAAASATNAQTASPKTAGKDGESLKRNGEAGMEGEVEKDVKRQRTE